MFTKGAGQYWERESVGTGGELTPNPLIKCGSRYKTFSVFTAIFTISPVRLT